MLKIFLKGLIRNIKFFSPGNNIRRSGEAHYHLGVALARQTKLHEAIISFEQAIGLGFKSPQLYYELAECLSKNKQFQEAVEYYWESIRTDPNADAYFKLGYALDSLDKLEEAAKAFEKAIEMQQSFGEAYNNLGFILQKQGKVKEAILCYRKALELNPVFRKAQSNLLLAILYSPEYDNQSLFLEHQRFERHFAEKCYQFQFSSHSNAKDHRRRLRIGYLSSDFRNHPVSYNIQPLFEFHDRGQFEIYCYAHVLQPSALTDWFKKSADKWVDISLLNDKQAAELIYRDKIDILVSLAGRFDKNRPLICAYKPAPIQASFHDAATSGLKVMDYLITDIVMSPKNTTEKFTEQPIRLPGFYLHGKTDCQLLINDLPAASNGFITFCSMNNPSKINEHVIELWANVLHAVPDSKILLKYKNLYSDSGAKQRLINLFSQQGVVADRLLFLSKFDNRENHLHLYHEADISLDTFPFTGSTATFESLFMGVPVITLAGERMVSRWSASMLKCLKMENWVAQTKEEYVNIAKNMALNIGELQKIRKALREQVINSSMCNAKMKTRHIERAYRYMWKKWCSQQGNS